MAALTLGVFMIVVYKLLLLAGVLCVWLVFQLLIDIENMGRLFTRVLCHLSFLASFSLIQLFAIVLEKNGCFPFIFLAVSTLATFALLLRLLVRARSFTRRDPEK